MRRLAPLALLLFASACQTVPLDPCIEENGADVWARGMEVMGETGSLQIRFDESSLEPPDVGLNEWQVTVMDAAGAGQTGCDIDVELWMPAHGHGAGTPGVVEMDAMAGAYEITPDFIMAGLWEITFTVSCGEQSDIVEVAFCLQG